VPGEHDATFSRTRSVLTARGSSRSRTESEEREDITHDAATPAADTARGSHPHATVLARPNAADCGHPPHRRPVRPDRTAPRLPTERL